jgi:hypothetical protein
MKDKHDGVLAVIWLIYFLLIFSLCFIELDADPNKNILKGIKVVWSTFFLMLIVTLIIISN